MRRLIVFAFCVASSAQAPPSMPKPIQIHVGPGKEVSILIPSVDQKQLREIVVSFFGQKDELSTENFRKVLDQSTNMTLVLTSK